MEEPDRARIVAKPNSGYVMELLSEVFGGQVHLCAHPPEGQADVASTSLGPLHHFGHGRDGRLLTGTVSRPGNAAFTAYLRG